MYRIEMNDVLWTDDMSILIKKDQMTDIWPSDANTLHENYNAMIRFMILYTLLLSLFKQNTVPFAMLFIFMIVFFLFYNLLYKSNKNPEKAFISMNVNEFMPDILKYNNNSIKPQTAADIHEYPTKHCKSSTETNPFMNPMLGDSMIENYKPICDYETPQNMDNLFVNSLPQSEWDIYNNQNSQRQFYTIPNHTSYADQNAYANWLYGDGSRKM